jgi:hypothetical protein
LHSGALEISPIEELFVLMRVGRLAGDSNLGRYYTSGGYPSLNDAGLQ